jgi:hypothetical protein
VIERSKALRILSFPASPLEELKDKVWEFRASKIGSNQADHTTSSVIMSIRLFPDHGRRKSKGNCNGKAPSGSFKSAHLFDYPRHCNDMSTDKL